MKSLYFTFVFSACMHVAFSQKQATIKELNKFQKADLYVEQPTYSLNGTWKGLELQYDRAYGFVTATYTYELTLQQIGNRVLGTSLIVDQDGNYSEMKLRGYVIGNKLHFEEYEINREDMKTPYMVWCYTAGELEIVNADGKFSLQGALDGYSSDNYRLCEATTVNLEAEATNEIYKTTSINKEQQTLVSLNTYPNPFTESINIEYSIPSSAKVRVEIYDLQGKRILILVNKEQSAGTYKETIDRGMFENTSGIYIVKVNVDGKEYSKQLVQSK